LLNNEHILKKYLNRPLFFTSLKL